MQATFCDKKDRIRTSYRMTPVSRTGMMRIEKVVYLTGSMSSWEAFGRHNRNLIQRVKDVSEDEANYTWKMLMRRVANKLKRLDR